MDNFLLITIIITLVFSGFFSGMEIAFISSNKLKIELDNKQGKIQAKILSYFIQRPSRFIGTMLVGNNIALVIYGIVMAKLLEPIIIDATGIESSSSILLVQTIVSTFIILITAEFLPKALFRINPNRVLSISAVPLFLIYWVLWLPVVVTIGISEWILKVIFKVDFSNEKVAFGKIDLDTLVKETTDNADEVEEVEHELHIFKNALNFSNIKARECMVPRTEIIAFDVEDEVEELRKKFVETGLSKIIIYRENIDNIIGYVHSYELFKNPEKIQNVLLPISIVPETSPVNTVLEQLLAQSRSLAIVVDEFGGTSGMLTMEDIMEELFGDIEDEHDSEEFIEEKLDDLTYVFSGRLDIDYLNDEYGLDLPSSEEYETMGGLIINRLEDLPEVNDSLEVGKYQISILEMSDTRIEKIELKIMVDA